MANKIGGGTTGEYSMGPYTIYYDEISQKQTAIKTSPDSCQLFGLHFHA